MADWHTNWHGQFLFIGALVIIGLICLFVAAGVGWIN